MHLEEEDKAMPSLGLRSWKMELSYGCAPKKVTLFRKMLEIAINIMVIKNLEGPSLNFLRQA